MGVAVRCFRINSLWPGGRLGGRQLIRPSWGTASLVGGFRVETYGFATLPGPPVAFRVAAFDGERMVVEVLGQIDMAPFLAEAVLAEERQRVGVVLVGVHEHDPGVALDEPLGQPAHQARGDAGALEELPRPRGAADWDHEPGSANGARLCGPQRAATFRDAADHRPAR